MEVIGFFALCWVMLCISAAVVGVGILGGTDLGPLPIEHYKWFLPVVLFTGYLWFLLIQNSPFTITVG